MARFSHALAGCAIAGTLAGCDLVFGLDGEATPCELSSFESATPVDVTEAEDFSFDWEETFGVVQANGAAYEIDPITAALTPIDLGPYNNFGLALTPEGNALFYTIVVEPPTLKGALRGGAAVWQLEAGVPRGTYAGTPSADVFGPRRVMVRMRDGAEEPVQEYEDVSGRWMPVGEPRVMSTLRAPNLTPNGLTMVYPGVTEVGEPAVFAAQRTATTAPFGDPQQILPGLFYTAQLVGKCERLYTSDGAMLRRYER